MSEDKPHRRGYVKPGRRKYPASEAAKEYERWGIPLGVTIAEWEAINAWPHFSLYPEAELARDVNDMGFFMYRNATDDERAVIERAKRSNREPPGKKADRGG